MTRVTALTVPAETRKQDAIYFRTMGMTYQEVFEAMLAKYGENALPPSYDVRYVYRDIQGALRKLQEETMESASQMRFIEAQRLDKLLLSVMPMAESGNLKAIDRVIKIMDHKAKLFGLYAPSQVKVQDWRSEVLQLLNDGRITIEDVERELGKDEARKLIESRSGVVVEGSYSEEDGGAKPDQ